MIDLLAHARARLARSATSKVIQEMAVVQKRLDIARFALAQCRSDGGEYRRVLLKHEATIAALRADLAMLKRALDVAVPTFNETQINAHLVATRQDRANGEKA